MKTAELTGAALDWAVASIELTGHDEYTNVLMVTVGDDNDWRYNPSTEWAQGGAIIESECITIEYAGVWIGRCWKHSDGDEQIQIEGATPLIAAMRCYVASKLGDEVEMPDALMSHA